MAAPLKIAPRPPVGIGIDIGQQVDPTTIVVSEATIRNTGRERIITPETTNPLLGMVIPAVKEPVYETLFTVRYAERLPLGTPYPVVAQQLALLLDSGPLQGRMRTVRVDITGVGRPIFEMVEAEVRRLPSRALIHLVPVTFTHGDRWDKNVGRLGKAFLVSRLQALIQSGQVKVSPHDQEMLAMCEELKVYEIHVSEDGNDKYGAFKVGKHDDLVTGLGLSVLEDPLLNTVAYGPKWY